MNSVINFRMTGQMKQWMRCINPRELGRRLDKNVGIATKKNAAFVKAEMKGRILAGKYVKNSPVTVILKAKGVPLMEDGDLVRAIDELIISPYAAFVGVKKNASGGSRNGKIPMVELAGMLQENIKIEFKKIGPAAEARIRTWFRHKAIETHFQIMPLSAGKRILRIPKRPFVEKVANNKKIQRKIISNWTNAVRQSLIVK